MSTPRKSAAERRAEIVATALALAAEIGPHKVSAEAIATRIGISQPAIFRHFPRKDEMWQAVVQWLFEQVSQRWAQALTAPPAGRLEAVIAAQFAFVARFPAMPLVMLSPELRRSCTAIGQGTERLMAAFHATLAEAVRQGQAAGALDAAIAPDAAAHMLLAVVQGTALRWAVGGARFDLTTEGPALARLAVSGLRQ